MTRARNPRRVVADAIKPMRSNVTAMWNAWSGPRHAEIGGRWQLAPADRQPENRAEEWRRLASFMDTVEGQARDVAAFARKRAAQLEWEAHDAAVGRSQ